VTVLITTHPGADFDGAAAMVAARHLYPGAILAFSGSAEEKVRAFFADHAAEVQVAAPKQVDLGAVTRLVLCDTHVPERAGHFAALAAKVPVDAFDHHPPEPGGDRLERRVVEPVGATATLMAEILRRDGVAVAPWEATLMALGVYEETGNLTFPTTTARDAAAAAWLIERGADLGEVRARLTQELNLEQLDILDRLAHQLEVRYLDGYKVGVAATHAARYVPEVAGVANRLLGMDPMDALVILVAMEDKVVLVARGTRPEIALGELARGFGGGGHATAASATLHDRTVIEAAAAVWTALAGLVAPLTRAAQIMTARPVTVAADATLAEAERVLTRYGVNSLPVMEGDRLAGVVTRETVQKGLFHQMADLPVADVMDAEPYRAAPDTPLREVQAHMVERNQRFVPVVEGDRLVGCVTRTDLLRVMHDDLRGASPPAVLREPHQRTVRDLVRRRIPPPVCALLEEVGREGEALGMGVYMVGGVVRDLLLERENLDIDLVAEGDAIALAQRWAARAGARVHTHDRFGTATVTLEREGLPAHFRVDLATARTEFYEYPSALPTVEHSSLKKDLYRRDFTINALAVALGPSRFGTLIDYFGGRRDIKDRQIRVLHALSILEDPTRALRAVRFATRYGFAIGAQTERLIRSAGKLGLYARLSGKRLSTELAHLLSDTDPVAGVAALGRMGVLAGIAPAFGDGALALPRLQRAAEALAWYRLQFADRPVSVWHVYLLALGSALAPDARRAFRDRLDLPGRFRATWERWDDLPARAEGELAGAGEADPLRVDRCLRGAPPEVLVHLMATTGSAAVQRAVTLYLSQIEEVRTALTGKDLEALGLPPGPDYRRILGALRDARIQGTVRTREDELDWLRAAGYT
jgi:tRNA nucleotidyltransferase (CCA-adding enzyme)